MSTGFKTIISDILANKEQIVLCPRSLQSSLLKLQIRNSQKITINPETIDERNNSLSVEFSTIDHDILFPIGFYDHYHKVTDENHRQDLGVVIDIHLSGVGNVTFLSGCVRVANMKLSIFMGEGLTIEKSSINVLSAEKSGMSLKYVGEMHIYETWGSYLFIELCGAVNLYSHSIARSVHHLGFYRLEKLVTDGHFIRPRNVTIFSLAFIHVWILNSSLTFIPQKFYHSDLDFSLTNIVRMLTIKNVTVHLINHSYFHAASSYLKIEAVSFYQKLTANQTSEEQFNLTENKMLELKQSINSISNISVFLLAKHFMGRDYLSDHTLTCTINKSVSCNVESKCPIGLPFPFDEHTFKSLKCHRLVSIGKAKLSFQ